MPASNGWCAKPRANDQEFSASHDAQDALVDSDNPYDLAFAEFMAAIHALLTDNAVAAAGFADSSMRLADKHGFPQFATISRIALGRAMAGCGAPAEGITLIREGLAGMATTGSRVGMTLYLTWLAEAELLAGFVDDSRRTVQQALNLNPQELLFRPASLQLRGELYARKGLFSKAEQDFREVINLSARMGARLFHDRAAESLQRLISTAAT